MCPHQSKHARRLAVPPMMICNWPSRVPREMGGAYPTQSTPSSVTLRNYTATYGQVPTAYNPPHTPHHRRTRTSRDQSGPTGDCRSHSHCSSTRTTSVTSRTRHLFSLRENGSHRAGTRDIPSHPIPSIPCHALPCPALPYPVLSSAVPACRQPPAAWNADDARILSSTRT